MKRTVFSVIAIVTIAMSWYLALASRAEVTEPSRYVALLSQSGTDAPVATVLKNTLGGTVVWTREPGAEDGVGMYYGTLEGAFPASRTVCLTSTIVDYAAGTVSWTRGQNDYIYLITGSLKTSYSNIETARSDDVLSLTPITCTVYPEP